MGRRFLTLIDTCSTFSTRNHPQEATWHFTVILRQITIKKSYYLFTCVVLSWILYWFGRIFWIKTTTFCNWTFLEVLRFLNIRHENNVALGYNFVMKWKKWGEIETLLCRKKVFRSFRSIHHENGSTLTFGFFWKKNYSNRQFCTLD